MMTRKNTILTATLAVIGVILPSCSGKINGYDVRREGDEILATRRNEDGSLNHRLIDKSPFGDLDAVTSRELVSFESMFTGEQAVGLVWNTFNRGYHMGRVQPFREMYAREIFPHIPDSLKQ